MLFYTQATGGSNTERMRIDSSGSVLIGTTSSSGSSVKLEAHDATNPIIQVKDTTSNIICGIQAGNSEAVIRCPQDSPLVFNVGASETERMRILASGGITFNGDTAAANALDDYEEGTWTPACGATLSTATGHYTKIGNQVTVHYHVVTTGGLPSSTGQVQISGLPFTIDSNGAGAIYARYYTPNDSTLTTILIDGESVIRLINTNEQNFDYTTWGELEASANNSVDIRGTATYKV